MSTLENPLAAANREALMARAEIAKLMRSLIHNVPQLHSDEEVVQMVEALARAHASMWIVNLP